VGPDSIRLNPVGAERRGRLTRLFAPIPEFPMKGIPGP
jgi:hypothetical protein